MGGRGRYQTVWKKKASTVKGGGCRGEHLKVLKEKL
jgi:hypothetical protein